MFNDFIKPVVVLVLICLVITGALAATNSVTEPIIADAAAMRAEQARHDIIPEATGFKEISTEGFPETVVEAYKSANDVGYVFIVSVSGYGGDIVIICGVNTDGRLIRSSTLKQSETKGLGSLITESAFENQFIGIDNRFLGVDTITGATISSKAYISAVKDALTAFGMIGSRE